MAIARFSNYCLGGNCAYCQVPDEDFDIYVYGGSVYYRYPFVFGDEVYYNYVNSSTPLEYARRLLLEAIYRGIVR